jgi:hypothetical protein
MFPLFTKVISLFDLLSAEYMFYICFTRPKRFMDCGKGVFRDQLFVTEPVQLFNCQTSYIFQIHLYSIFLVTDSVPVYRVTR